MKKLILSTVVLALTSLVSANAATVIETVNFDAPGGLTGIGAPYTVTNYAGAGADTGGVTSEYWNPIAFNGTTSGDKASDGTTPSGITFTDASPYRFSYGSPSPISLFDPFLLNQTGHAVTETLNNVPIGIYNLFVYSQNGGFASNGGVFSVNGGPTQSVSNDGTDHSTFILGVNYVEFTGITLYAPGTISLSWNVDPNGEGDLNGVQLQSLAVPEPSTWAMLLGGASLIVFLQRRRANAKV
jgi:hypothetical protein